MPKGDVYGRPQASPGSRKYAERLGGSHSKLQLQLYPLAWEDTVWVFDDFMQDTINLDFYVLSADATATTFAATSTPLRGGTITGNTGTTDNGFHSIKGLLAYFGDNNCGMEIRFKQDAVTGHAVEMGFTDALTDDTLPAINDIDTPTITNGAVDVAIIVKDTDQTLTTLAFVTDGNTADFNTTKTNLGTQDLTAATYMTGRVGIAGDAAYCGLYGADGELLQFASHGIATASSVEGGDAVAPWFISGTRNTTDKITDIDFICSWEDRSTRPS